MIIRQGDLTLVSVDNTPTVVGEAKTQVLALGEESGHWHSIASSIITDIEGERFVTVTEDSTLQVEPESHAYRHAPIQVPKGTWKVLGEKDEKSIWLGQREYTPEAIRRVAD